MALSVFDVNLGSLRSTRAVLINGTHLSTPPVADASKRAAEIVRAAGGRVVLDIDGHPESLKQVLPICDLVVGTQEEIHILGGSTDTLSAVRTIRSYTRALIVIKRGAEGCVCYEGANPGEGFQWACIRG